MWHFGNWGHVFGISAMKYEHAESWQLFLESFVVQMEPLDTLAWMQLRFTAPGKCNGS
jgi:hypothetical protein